MLETVLMISIAFRPNIGGVETHLDDLCNYLTKHWYRVYVVTYQPITTNAKGKWVEKRGRLVVHRIPLFGHGLFHKLESYPLLEFLYLTPMLLFYSLFFMLKHWKEIGIIHAHGLNAALVAKTMASLFNKRFVVSIHAIYCLRKRPLLAKLLRWVLSPSTRVMAASEKTREDILAIGLPEAKVSTFVHWIDQSLFRPLDRLSCKKSLGLKDTFVVLYVGRFIKKKGIRLLLEVASKINLEDVTFAFIGDGPLANEIREKASLERNVMFVGKVGLGEIVKYYNAAELVVVPSIYEEPLGRVMLEALSCGVPVIASNVGGIPEVLNPSVGAVFKPNVDELDRSIRYFYINANKLQQMAKNCRNYATTYFSEKNAETIEKNYQLP